MSRRIRPIHGFFFVALVVGAFLVADMAMKGAFAHEGYVRVSPDRQGRVQIPLDDLSEGDVRFFRFLNAGNQEVKFFVARDREGTVQVALDANEVCYKLKRGYSADENWVVCNKCDKAFRITEINQGGGGCKPIPLEHRIEDDILVLDEARILEGWRYFR